MLSKAVDKPCHAARIGGDEFAVLLPATDERGGEAVMETIQKLVELNNQFYSASAAHSLAWAPRQACPASGSRDVAKRADALMYEAKRALLFAERRPRTG